MNIDAITLQCFLAVAKTGHMTKAAAQVGRTQSALSQQIAKLEAMLGKPLFVRGKALSLTQDGEIFLDYARQIFALHREMIDTFKQPELEGEVRFGMPEDFASVYLSDVLVEFVRLHPRIFVKIECDLTLNLYNRFKQGDFDLALVKMNRPEDVPHSVDIYSEKLEWVGHEPSVILDKKDKPLPLVLSPTPCVYRARAVKALEKAGIKSRLVFSSPSYAGKIAAVKAGLGITVLPRTMIPTELQALTYSHLPFLEDTHICLLKQNSHNPALLSFEKFVLAKLKH
jgi:DNA-binding transcriptional LysR family regulator